MSVRDQTYAALRTFGGSAVLTLVDAGGYPVSLRCRPEPAGDPAVLEIACPAWLEVEPGRACLMAHSHDEDLWNLRGILAKGTVALDGDRIQFAPDTFRWLADTGGGALSAVRIAAGAILRTRRDAAAFLRRTGQPARDVPWRTVIEARKRAKRAARRRPAGEARRG
jgi:hypothetical protein